MLWTLLACSPQTPETPVSSSAPALADVVLIVVDTLRADALGFMGQAQPTSPKLDALAQGSAWYPRAYAASAWTLPSTATLLTGAPPWVHRVVADPTTKDFGRLDAGVPVIAEFFKGQGYRTAAWVTNAFLAPEFGLDRGFDVYDYEGADVLGHRTARETVDAALAWLQADDQPSFLLVHVMEPHLDYEPQGPHAGAFTQALESGLALPLGDVRHAWMDREVVPSVEDQAFVRAAYLEEVRATDDALGVLLDGLDDTTRLVVTSDHGEEFWDFGGFEHGHSTKSPVGRVPLIVSGPQVPAGRQEGVVDATAVAAFLTSGQLPVTGSAVVDGTVYGLPQLSYVTDDHSLELELSAGQAALWTLEDGVEQVTLHDEALQQRLVGALVQRRGHLDPVAPANAIEQVDGDILGKLKALGYVEN